MRRVVWCQNAINFKLIAKKKYRNKNADKKMLNFYEINQIFFRVAFISAIFCDFSNGIANALWRLQSILYARFCAMECERLTVLSSHAFVCHAIESLCFFSVMKSLTSLFGMSPYPA